MKYIVAPKNYHLSLLNLLREDDPFLDIKLVSKEELSRSVYCSIEESALVYLMKEHHLSYEISKMYLSDIRFIESDSKDYKIHFLFSLRKELSEKGFVVPPLDSDFSDKEVDAIGYPKEDFELSSLLNKLNIVPNYLFNKTNKNDREVVTFEKVEDEIYYVLNQIATLIDNKVDINDIYIFRRSEVYDYYLKKFSSLFGYQINIKNSNSIYLTGGVKRFLYYFDLEKDISISLTKLKEEMKDDPLYLDIEDLVNNSILEDVDFEIQKDYLVNKFKEKKLPSAKYKNAVNVIDSPIYEKGKHIFVIGLAQGSFPKSVKDDKYLNGVQLSSINRLNSKDKTKLDELSLIDFFNSVNNFYYSFSKKSKEGETYLSPLTKKLPFNKVSKRLDDIFYSEDVLKLIYSNLKDMEEYYKEKGENYYKVRDVVSIDYNTYSNKYLYKANAYDDKKFIGLSTTSLDLYSNCPFHYYLDRVLKLDESEESYSLSLGIIAHHIFEHFRDENFDFDTEFDSKLSEYTFKSSEKYVLTHNVKNQLKEAIKAIKLREKYYSNPKIYNEVNFKYNLNKNTLINGKIDNFVILDDKYFLCIDYKTGSTKFDESKLEYGLSTQLPTYALLTKNEDKYKDLDLAGLYINNVLTSSLFIKQKEDELIPGYLKLNGKTLGDLDVVKLIDSTIADGKSSFISGVSLKNDLSSLKDVKAIVSPFTFDEYVDKVRNLYVEMDNNLRNNVFDIRPLYFSNRDNACLYCPYKDVCFVRAEQYRDLSKKEEDEDE